MNALLHRQAQVLEAIVGDDSTPEEAEALVHELVRAPRNRRELRDQIRQLPRNVRRMAGFGEWRFGLGQ